MALGSEGPGGVHFDDAELARTIGVIAVVARGSTVVHAGDRLYLLGRGHDRGALEARLRG